MIHRSTLSEDPIESLYRDWRRLGVAVTSPAADYPVDVETLVIRTAMLGDQDERIFICAASWLSRFHSFVDGRRLSELTRGAPAEVRARLGVLLTLATEGDGAAGKAPSLISALSHCKPTKKPRPFYQVSRDIPALASWSKRLSHPLFRRWGYWHDDIRLKPESVRPLPAILAVPELRIRAIMGPSLEASIVAIAVQKSSNAYRLGRQFAVSYSAVHAAIDRLVGRGLLQRLKKGAGQELHPTELLSWVLSSERGF